MYTYIYSFLKDSFLHSYFYTMAELSSYNKNDMADIPWWFSVRIHVLMQGAGSLPGPGRFHLPWGN